jgi:uncharacterized protein (TIGR02001 family)
MRTAIRPISRFQHFNHPEKSTMKKTLIASLLAAGAVLPMAAMAEDAKPAEAPKPDWTLAGNFGLSSEYLYRGIAQTDHKPAVSGGFDLTHASGFYLGNWDSTISWISGDLAPTGATSAPIEMDFYGGYKFEVVKDWTLDVGMLEYYYPVAGTKPATNPNTFEIYVAGSYGPATLKYSQALTNLFGTADSKSSGYLDLSLSFDLGNGFTFAPHVGHQKVGGAANTNLTYSDYNLKVTKDLSGWAVGLGYYGTNAKDAGYLLSSGASAGSNLGKSRLVASVTKSF